jgi:sulfhydrogenase subunit beta (sulfur reductase)
LETFLASEKVSDLVRHLSKNYTVIAPVAKGPAFVFAEVEDPAVVALDYNTTILPPKKFFMPAKEELLNFNRSTGDATVPQAQSAPKVLLGVHSYDMQGILRLDELMKDGNPDKAYIARRQNTLFIGVAFTPDEYHFSESVGIGIFDMEGFDAFLTPAAGGYILKTLTPEGEKLLKGFSGAPVAAKPKAAGVFQKKIMPDLARIPSILDKAYGGAVWKNNGDKCLSCGSCNLVCPTCYCFDVRDEVNLDMTTGCRSRLWDACQTAPFAEVAGGENFRHKRESRVRHRAYRKFRYLSDKYPKPFCVGCGRCNRACTAKISIVEMINEAAASV